MAATLNELAAALPRKFSEEEKHCVLALITKQPQLERDTFVAFLIELAAVCRSECSPNVLNKFLS
jgi:hypothetical protein